MLGLGIGIIIGAVFMAGYGQKKQFTRAQIEEEAKGYGMYYPGENPVISKKEVGK